MRGKALPHDFPIELEGTPGQGVRSTFRHATLRSDGVAKFFSYFNGGYNTSLRREGDSPLWTLVASVEGDPNDPNKDLTNTHELHGNVLSQSVMINPALRAKFVSPNETLTFVQGLAQQVVAGKLSWSGAVAKINGADAPLAVSEETDAAEVLRLLTHGVEHYHAFSYAYRHTFNYGPLGSGVTNFGNVGSVYTTNELRSGENIPASFNLPAGEWLKIFPTSVQMLGQRKQLTYEYWWANVWERMLYLPKV